MYAISKLKEANFFWEKVKKSPAHTDEFVFYFSAFFSAFRSITFSLQKAHKKQQNFEVLYEKILKYIKEHPPLNELVDARNIALKEGAKVPILVTTIENLETNDIIEFQCDPLDRKSDVIRNVNVEMGFRGEFLIPCGLQDEIKSLVYISQLDFIIKQMFNAKISITYLIKLKDGGQVIEIDKLKEVVDNALTFLNKIVPEFEKNFIPNGNLPTTKVLKKLHKLYLEKC